LKENGFPLSTCRRCHGDDYGGGDAGFSCTATCHTKGVEWCGTCHDGHAPPKPVTGNHAAHKLDCTNCHQVPKSAREKNHPDGTVEVVLSGLAQQGTGSALWKPEERRCANVYCHGSLSPVWGSP